MNNYRQGGRSPEGDGYDPYGPLAGELKRNANIAGAGLLLTHTLTMVISYIIYIAAGLISYDSFTGVVYDILENSASLAAYVIGFAAPVFLMVKLIRIPAWAAFPMKAPKISLLATGIFACLGVSVLGMYLSDFTGAAIRSIFGVTPTMPYMTMPQGGAALAVYIVNVVFAPAILEEMMFRGVILQSLRRFGDLFALIVTSLLFAMLHGNLVQGPNAFIMGIAIGYFVLRTGSLMTGIIIHFVNNGIAVSMDLLMRSMPDRAGIISFCVIAVYALGGLAAAAALIIQEGWPPRLAPSSLRMPERRKYQVFFTSFAQIALIFVTLYFTYRYLERF